MLIATYVVAKSTASVCHQSGNRSYKLFYHDLLARISSNIFLRPEDVSLSA
jgi:hypothetical protein